MVVVNIIYIIINKLKKLLLLKKIVIRSSMVTRFKDA